MTAVSNTEVNGNPFGMAYAARGDWAEGLDVTIMESGCRGRYSLLRRLLRLLRQPQPARWPGASSTICKAAGIKVGILGKEEKCCGEPVRKLGNEYLYQMTANENIELIKGYGVKQIVTTCPHCFNTLARDYKDLGLDLPVEHYSTFVSSLITDGRLKLKQDPEPFKLYLP